MLALSTLGLALLAAAAEVPSPAALGSALDRLDGATFALVEKTAAREAPRVVLVDRVPASAESVRKLLVDPAAYLKAVPSFRRAEVLKTVPRPGGIPDRLLAWELEIPLWNLKGKLWMRARPEGVELELAEGDFAPGRYVLTATEERPSGSLLVVDGRANVREANWLTKRLVERNPLAAPAMAAAASWVLLRAMALAAVPGRETLRRPTASPGPLNGWPQVGAVAEVAAPALRNGFYPGVVVSRRDGRLAYAAFASPTAHGPEAATGRLADPKRWRAVPGWGEIEVKSGNGVSRWEVDGKFPFVDFDATWDVTVTPPGLRGRASQGPARGAWWTWQLAPTAPRGSLAVFAVYPRLEKTGYLPRKFVEAEPLLEHGLALGLAFVDALSLLQTIGPAQLPQGAQ